MSNIDDLDWENDDIIIVVDEDDEEDTAPPSDPQDDLLYTAWAIIANAGGGDWTKEAEEWQQAATRWRDQWHAFLDQRRGES